ncbi:hypothetical protein PILCRDRAFT_90617 [Piloderma croceum F 1598]|uniref:Protein kinase domain-containing protein n=1 Tax=Piloderma croceum (strain F 1598) TaxID=765440 RepID=A0A0C3FEY3_PILCF|nr:hypothetical protein PILCRDRAFT_90617 [Piloderma croceum F 1598]
MPPTLHLWSGNSIEYRAAVARIDARRTAIIQIEAGLDKLKILAASLVNVPCLTAITQATRQVIIGAQQVRTLKMQALMVAEEVLQISLSVAYFVQVNNVTEADMRLSLKKKLYRFAGELEDMSKWIDGFVLRNCFSRVFRLLWNASYSWNIVKCKETLKYNRKILFRDYCEYHPIRIELTLALKEQETARVEDETACDPQHTEVENELIPGPVDLTANICRMDQHPIAHGGFADIWRATWITPSGTCIVAVKVLRYSMSNSEVQAKMTKRLHREIRIWKTFTHDNVLPFHGTTSGFGPHKAMVCSWAQNGNLNDYLRDSEVRLRLSDRSNLLRDIAAGLSYLHSFKIIHGDLTGSNVLIDSNEKARLSDFGMSTIIADCQGSNSFFSTTIGGAIRWSDVALYRFEQAPALSIYTDLYSFGSVMLQARINPNLWIQRD